MHQASNASSSFEPKSMSQGIFHQSPSACILLVRLFFRPFISRLWKPGPVCKLSLLLHSSSVGAFWVPNGCLHPFGTYLLLHSSSVCASWRPYGCRHFFGAHQKAEGSHVDHPRHTHSCRSAVKKGCTLASDLKDKIVKSAGDHASCLRDGHAFAVRKHSCTGVLFESTQTHTQTSTPTCSCGTSPSCNGFMGPSVPCQKSSSSTVKRAKSTSCPTPTTSERSTKQQQHPITISSISGCQPHRQPRHKGRSRNICR